MKISLVADIHLNKTIYKGVMDEEFDDLPFRNADFMRAFKFIVDKNINEIHPDLMVILGDVYDTPHPLNPTRTFFNSQLRRLSENSIPTIILVGNHDICSKHHALEPIGALGLKHVKVIETPKLVAFKDKLLMLFPYSFEVEQERVKIRDQFHSFVEYSHKQIESKPEYQGKELMFFGHFGVNGAVKNSYEEEEDSINITQLKKETKKEVINRNEGDISLSDLDTIGADYIFLGDYHHHQILKTKKTISFYIGSIEKSNFSEKDQKKGFVVYDSDKKSNNAAMGNCQFIEYPDCRPMIELKGTYDEMLKDAESHNPSTRTLVKLYFVGNSNQLMDYSIKNESFKKKLEDKFNPIYIYSKQKVVDEEEEKEASDVENNILNNGHIGDNDVKEAVEDMIKEKEKDSGEQDILIKMSRDVYEETKMEQ